MNKPHAFAAFSFKRFLIDGNKLFFLIAQDIGTYLQHDFILKT